MPRIWRMPRILHPGGLSNHGVRPVQGLTFLCCHHNNRTRCGPHLILALTKSAVSAQSAASVFPCGFVFSPSRACLPHLSRSVLRLR